MYDEAQERFKQVREEERFLFKVVKSKKRKPKQEPATARLSQSALNKIFDVKKYVVPASGSSSNKGLPSSCSSSSQDDGQSQI